MDIKQLTTALNESIDATGIAFTIKESGMAGSKQFVIAELDAQQTANLLKLVRTNPGLMDRTFGPIALSLNDKTNTLRIVNPNAVTQDQVEVFQRNASAIQMALKTGDAVKVGKVLDSIDGFGDLLVAAKNQDVDKGVLFLRTAVGNSNETLAADQEDALIKLGQARAESRGLPVTKSPDGARRDYLNYGRQSAREIISQYDRDPAGLNQKTREFLAQVGVPLLGVKPLADDAKVKDYKGDFNYDGLDSSKYKGKVFVDGDYQLPPVLKAAALKAADELLTAEGPQGVMKLLPGVDMNGNGKPSREEVAAYLLAQSMDTGKPGLFTQGHGKVESTFTNNLDTSRHDNEYTGQVIHEVARQIYGDNFDPSMGTNTPAADAAFTDRLDSTLPTPKC